MKNELQNKIGNFLRFPFLITVVLLICTGCMQSVPIKQNFPEAPAAILQECPSKLKTLKEDPKLSEVSKIIVENYRAYYECANKTSAWIEWYNTQKKIFEEVNEK
jgi:hypothetical protein